MPTPHRILHVLPWLSSGGVEKRRLQLVKHLDSQRYTQRVICKEASAPMLEQIERHAEVIVTGGSWRLDDLGSMHTILDEIERWRPDVIHGAVFEGVVMAAVCGYLGGVPHRIIEETGVSPHRSWRGDALMNLMSQLSDRCVAVSEHAGAFLQERSQIASARLKVIPNGVELLTPPTTAQRASARAHFGLPKDAFVVGSVGRLLDSHKRFSDVIAAVEQLIARDPHLHLLIAGGGHDEQALKALVLKRGLEDKIHLVGYQRDIATVFASMDLFVLASSFEAFGLVIAEAMSSGLPVIGTDVGEIPVLVTDHHNGLIVPVGAPHRIAEAISALRQDPDRLVAMGRASRERAVTRYSSARYIEDVDELYRDVIAS